MKTLLCVLGCLLVVPVHAIDGTQLLAAVDRNLEPESYEMYRKLINIEPDGTRKEFVLYSVKKGRDKIVALFLSPSSEKGRATLRLGENMWLYIPEVGKPLRITSLQSVTGGVFNNADILRIDYAAEYDVEQVDDSPDQHLLHLKAKSGEVAYDRLKMWVDKATMLPTRIECRAASGLLIKTLHFKDVQDFGEGIRRPATLETDSPLHQGYQSVMLFSRIHKRDLADEVFSLNYLPRVDDLRR
ncbi:MAG: outer membrane lipoprotein-sorting protein [Thiotrichales bacterium]